MGLLEEISFRWLAVLSFLLSDGCILISGLQPQKSPYQNSYWELFIVTKQRIYESVYDMETYFRINIPKNRPHVPAQA